MYAVIEDRGSQYTVREGDTLAVDLGRWDENESIVFDRVVVVGGEQGVQVGQPTVTGARVTATVLGETKGQKIVVLKFKRRKRYRRKQGHRQRYTRVRIDRIEV
jgi:large subunit ribosomal protein L21